MVETSNNKNYLKVIVLLVAIIVMALGGFLVYKGLSKEEKETEEIKSSITPLLYKVTKEGSDNTMYLFGSIHVAKKEDLVFPEYVLKAYNDSHYLVCEISQTNSNLDLETTQKMISAMMYQDGTILKDHLKEETYNKVINFLNNRNIYTSAYEVYKPGLLVTELTGVQAQDLGLSGNNSVDDYFITKAGKDGKTIVEVENLDFQINLLVGFSDDFYDLLINQTIDNYDEGVKSLKELYDAWKTGNVEALKEVVDDEVEEEDTYTKAQKKEIEEYNKAMYTDRNIEMVNKAKEMFENNQDVFYMVGTAHIVADDGLVKGLQDAGYTVTRVK